MYERFTDHARKVMQLATEETKRLNHDRGEEPPLPPPTKQASEQPVTETAVLPEACPKCGQPVVRVIWRWSHLFGKNLEDVQAGRAILGSPLDKRGPPWVCLHCKPKWAEVHLLALEQHDLQIEKENAIVATDFEKAAQCRDMQAEVRRRLILLLEELSRNQWTPFSTPFFLSTLAATWGA